MMSTNKLPHTFSVACKSLEDTLSLARTFAVHLNDADIIYLHGDLGAGKTTFVQGVATVLGIAEPVTSPTFNLMFQYPIPSKEHALGDLYHFDLYRIHDAQELGETGLLDVAGYEGVTFIEWGEPYKELLSNAYFEITIERSENRPDERIFHFSATGASEQERLAEAFKREDPSA